MPADLRPIDLWAFMAPDNHVVHATLIPQGTLLILAWFLDDKPEGAEDFEDWDAARQEESDQIFTDRRLAMTVPSACRRRRGSTAPETGAWIAELRAVRGPATRPESGTEGTKIVLTPAHHDPTI